MYLLLIEWQSKHFAHCLAQQVYTNTGITTNNKEVLHSDSNLTNAQKPSTVDITLGCQMIEEYLQETGLWVVD